MGFFNNIFGNNKTNSSGSNQENFVVDETGNAKEASSAHIAPVTQNVNVNPVKTAQPVVSKTAEPETPTQTLMPETSTQSDGEYVGDTSAFDELMKQAESSIDARVLDEPIIDPEFKKIQDEIKEEGIELFQAE